MNAAQRLAALGLYQEIDGEGRLRNSTSAQIALTRRLLVTSCGAIYNFTRWSFEYEGERFRINVHGAIDWPETIHIATEGFIADMSERASGKTIRVASQPVTPDDVAITGYRVGS